MGSLNEILGGILGNLGGGSRSQASGSPQASGQDGGNSLLKLAMQLIQKHGGVGGLLNKIKDGGLGKEADSWVGAGNNAAVSGEQVTQAFGKDEIDDLAAKAGVAPEQASSGLAGVLPDLINQLTPDGKVPDNLDDMLKKAMSSFFK